MPRLVKLQLLGPLTVFIAVLAAETAVCALAANPTSETLWYINLKLFGIFQKSHYIMSDLTTVPGSQLIFIALPIFATSCYGVFRNQTLPLAIRQQSQSCLCRLPAFFVESDRKDALAAGIVDSNRNSFRGRPLHNFHSARQFTAIICGFTPALPLRDPRQSLRPGITNPQSLPPGMVQPAPCGHVFMSLLPAAF